MNNTDERKTQIRAELEAARASFHQLLDSIKDADLNCISGNEEWTIKQELVHTADSQRLMRRMIERAQRGKMSAYAIKPPRWLVDWVRQWIVERGARKMMRDSISRAYDANHRALLTTLDSIQDDDWTKSIAFTSASRSIAEWFQRPAAHLAEHATNIRKGLA